MKTLYRLLDRFLALFSEAPSVQLTEMLNLMQKFPDAFQATLNRYGNVATVCIEPIETELPHEVKVTICIQPNRMFLDTPYGYARELNRRERIAVVDAVNVWSAT